MKNGTGALVALLLAFLTAGCQGTRVEFEDVSLDRLDLSSGRNITGRASGLFLFDCIPINVHNRQQRAYEMLKQEAGSGFLTDIRVQDSWKFVFIGFKYSTVMTATSYLKKSDRSNGKDADQTLTQKLEELKKLRDKKELSEAEYEAARKKLLGQ